MPMRYWVERAFATVLAASLAGCASAQSEFTPVPERVASQEERDDQAKTIILNDVAIPVTVNLDNIALDGEHEIKVLDSRRNLVALVDSYASRPQGMSRCQAGHERYLRLIDETARRERYATLIESCMENVGVDDEPITWSEDGRSLTVNLYTSPPITLNIATDGTVTRAN